MRLKTERERVAQETYVHNVEDRAHREVDHAREKDKATVNKLETGRARGRAVETI